FICSDMIGFRKRGIAARVLSKGHHVLHNAELSVRKPASKDPRKLLLRGINPNTDTEMIELYVENTMGQEDYSLYPSPGRDLILIQFYEPLATGRLNAYLSFFLKTKTVDAVLALSHKLEGAELSVKPYFDFLVPVESKTSQEVETSQDTTENSEEVNDIEMQTSPPTAASSSNHPASEMALEPVAAPPPLPTKVEEVEVEEVKEEEAEEVMEDQSDDSDTITCHIALTDPGKHALFQHSTIQRDIKNTNPNVIIQTKDDGVYIEGPDRAQAEQVKQTIMDFLCNIAEAHFTLELEKAQFLARKDVKERLLQAMTQSGSSTLYTVSDSNITVTSLAQDSAKKACSFLKSQVCYFSMLADQENECMLYCREWSEFLQTLSFCSVKVSERGGNIDVWTLTGMENEKQAAIMQFLTTPIERETVISMEPGVLKYIQIHCHQLLADMDQVSIFPLEAEDNCGLKIHGHVVACQMAEEVLQGVVSSICTRTITANTPGVARFLGEKECQSILNEMEAKFCVYISPKYVPWKPLPHQENMDNVDLYTASDDPSSLMDQDSDVTAVDSDQNTASGLLFNNGALGHSSDLEEEAQLSLAIQYSMESSHWTPEDEEEQLQKALELSRNMSQKESSSNGADETPQVHQPKKANINIPLKDAIEAKVSQRQVEEKIEHRNLRNMSEYYKTCLDVIKRKHAVEIQIQGTIITVSGFKDFVMGAVYDYSVLSNFPEATKVDEESDEFQNVVKQFYETIQEYHSKIRIIQVEKLMNKLLYNQYKLKKASVLQRATYPQIERTLYHGTSESSVKEICIHGFNRSFCGKNATVYGQGVYFAVNSALSVQDQYSPPNADGYKFIFVSKVLTGDYTKGCHSIKTAPLKETGDIPLRYDSVTDNITKPSMFVIFNDTQAFPEYLITCQRIHPEPNNTSGYRWLSETSYQNKC
uniref:Poly [ADP-ribose] polymerase n=1 Tax=Neolamprologus brichardi TaxID=32507 RepID=A0A3Q4G4Y7_NEOBR